MSTTKAIGPPLGAEDGGTVVLDESEQPTEQSTPQVADAAQNGGRERLDPDEEAR